MTHELTFFVSLLAFDFFTSEQIPSFFYLPFPCTTADNNAHQADRLTRVQRVRQIQTRTSWHNIHKRSSKSNRRRIVQRENRLRCCPRDETRRQGIQATKEERRLMTLWTWEWMTHSENLGRLSFLLSCRRNGDWWITVVSSLLDFSSPSLLHDCGWLHTLSPPKRMTKGKWIFGLGNVEGCGGDVDAMC